MSDATRPYASAEDRALHAIDSRLAEMTAYQRDAAEGLVALAAEQRDLVREQPDLACETAADSRQVRQDTRGLLVLTLVAVVLAGAAVLLALLALME